VRGVAYSAARKPRPRILDIATSNGTRNRPNHSQLEIFRACHTGKSQGRNIVESYVKKVLDNPLPIGAGALVVGILQWKRIKARNEAASSGQIDCDAELQGVLSDDDWRIVVYKTLPLRHVSRLWGCLNDVFLPVWLRKIILGWYVKSFDCDLSEAQLENLEEYDNLGMFFRRRLKESVRPISEDEIVCPCDGKVLHFGTVDVKSGLVEQVKGLTYSLGGFLGSYFNSTPHTLPVKDDQVAKEAEEMQLYQCVIYIAPGDYHCFHSPVDWVVKQRRHFPGELLSVNPAVVSKVNKVFQLNERAVYLGEWKHGFFSFAAVGATNVGSIKIGIDPEMSTNHWRWESDTFHLREFEAGVSVEKGQLFGEFNLGSTIVLIFEGPVGFQFGLRPGQTVKMGQSIRLAPENSTPSAVSTSSTTADDG